MIKKILDKHIFLPRIGLLFKLFIATVVISTIVSCSKDDVVEGRKDYLVVSESEDSREAVSELEVSIEGGRDTLFVFANFDFDTFFQTDNELDWVSVESAEYLNSMKATRLILKIEPLVDNFKMRSGMLNLSNKAKYLGQFIKITQGYTHRLSEDFLWLKFGNGNPFIEIADVAMDRWSAAQKQYGWTSTIPEGLNIAHTYGKNGFVRLGSSESGADIITPIISGLEQDSTMLLTFNAVAFTTLTGESDFNKLTVKILNGGEFDSGETVLELALGYYDPQSPLVVTSMWNSTFYSLPIKKPRLNANASTMQIQFLTGDNLNTSSNRIFLDNVNLFSVFKYEPEEPQQRVDN